MPWDGQRDKQSGDNGQKDGEIPPQPFEKRIFEVFVQNAFRELRRGHDEPPPAVLQEVQRNDGRGGEECNQSRLQTSEMKESHRMLLPEGFDVFLDELPLFEGNRILVQTVLLRGREVRLYILIIQLGAFALA